MEASNTATDTVESLKAQLASTQMKLVEAEQQLATERAGRTEDQTLITHLKLVIAKMQRERFGVR